MDLTFLKSKKIAILGFGREGRALLEFFSSRDIRPTVLDANTDLVLLPENTQSILGPDYLRRLPEFDVIFRSPGIKRLLPEISVAEKSGTEISSSTILFFLLWSGKIIGVSGTKGKGTTSNLIYKIFKQAGRKVFLGGNIGNPSINFLEDGDPKTVAVLELSSFQLQDLNTSPNCAVFLNLIPEHLDYHRDLNEYQEAKLNLVAHQKPGDTAVLSADDDFVRESALKTPAKKVWFSLDKLTEPGAFLQGKKLYVNFDGQPKEICHTDELKILGRHNVSNVLAAVACAASFGIESKTIRKTVIGYTGITHHRLEFIRDISKVSYYNDSAATIPEATKAALSSFDRPIVLIAGGFGKHDRQADMAKIIIENKVKAIVLIGKTGPKILAALKELGYAGSVVLSETMTDAVHIAAGFTKSGDIVLLSPGDVSFGMFKNYEDRGEQFTKAVKELHEASKIKTKTF